MESLMVPSEVGPVADGAEPPRGALDRALLLIDLLAGPCASTEPGRRPLLLVIDDLEQILIADPHGPHRVDPATAPVLAAVLRAFDPVYTDSRLVVTSRYQFTLDGLPDRLEQIALRPWPAGSTIRHALGKYARHEAQQNR